MKSIKFIIAAAIAASLTVSSYATVTINFGTGYTSYISDSGGAANDGTQLANNDLLEVGTWASIPSSITSGNLGAELASFTVFGTGSVNEGGGAFGGSANLLGSLATAYTGDQVVFIAFNTPNGATPTPNDGNEVAIFYEVAGNWTVPANGPTASTGIDVGDLFGDVTGLPAPVSANAHILWGTPDTDAENGYTLIDTKGIIVAVPEPSSIALVVMGLLGGLGLIRRRRS